MTSSGPGALDGKRVAVTGSSRGLGRAFALALAAAGARVVVNATDAARLAETVRDIEATGGVAVPVVGSVADEAVAGQIVQTCVDAFGGIDCLINNAGIVRDRTLLKMSVAEFDEVVAVHLRGTFLCGRAAALAMKDEGAGQIINVVSSFEGQVGQSNYAAAKAGAASLVRSWAGELRRHGIRVNGFWPIAETDMTEVMIERIRSQATQAGSAAPDAASLGFGAPDEVALAVVHMVSDRFIDSGEIVCFNGRRLWRWTFPGVTAMCERDEWDLESLAEALSPPV